MVSDTTTHWHSAFTHWLHGAIRRVLPCSSCRRHCHVEPIFDQLADIDYVCTRTGVALRVRRVVPYQAANATHVGADETDAAAAADAAVNNDSDDDGEPITADFWFNHWQGPHLVSEPVGGSSGGGGRRVSVNQFGPADHIMSQRRQSMATLISTGSGSPRRQSHCTQLSWARAIATDLVERAVERAMERAATGERECAPDVPPATTSTTFTTNTDIPTSSATCTSYTLSTPSSSSATTVSDTSITSGTSDAGGGAGGSRCNAVLTETDGRGGSGGGGGVVNPAFVADCELDEIGECVFESACSSSRVVPDLVQSTLASSCSWSREQQQQQQLVLSDVTTDSSCTDPPAPLPAAAATAAAAAAAAAGGGGGGHDYLSLSAPDHSRPDFLAATAGTDDTLADQKALLFFVHGVGDSLDVWTPQINFFSKQGYECVSLDLPGHGFSSAPSGGQIGRHLYRFDSVLDQVRRVYLRYAVHRRHVVLIGHAYGSSVAAALTRQFSNVTLLVLLACGGPCRLTPPGPPSRHQLPLPLCLLTCLRPLLMCGFKSREMFFSPLGKSHPEPPPSDTPSYVVRAFARGQVWPAGDLSFHRRILMPTLLVYGLRDTRVPLTDMCDMEKAIPRAFLETIPSAGHTPHQETPHETNRVIGQFLTRWQHLLRK